MKLDNIAYRRGKYDYLDSTGYFPGFSFFINRPLLPWTTDTLDSYAMGFELASAFAALITERAHYLYAKENVHVDPNLLVAKSSLWGNHK